MTGDQREQCSPFKCGCSLTRPDLQWRWRSSDCLDMRTSGLASVVVSSVKSRLGPHCAGLFSLNCAEECPPKEPKPSHLRATPTQSTCPEDLIVRKSRARCASTTVRSLAESVRWSKMNKQLRNVGRRERPAWIVSSANYRSHATGICPLGLPTCLPRVSSLGSCVLPLRHRKGIPPVLGAARGLSPVSRGRGCWPLQYPRPDQTARLRPGPTS